VGIEPDEPLKQLAREWGMQVTYEDVTGKQHSSSADSLLKVLALLGAPIAKIGDVPDALRRRRQSIAQTRL
jgi:4-alpha-glucanotransferase